MADKYILDGHETRPADLLEWASWFENTDRTVAKTTVGRDAHKAEVSTVFLGLDHSFGTGPPLLFETLVIGGPLDEEMERYSTWDDAEAGHAAMVERVSAARAGGRVVGRWR
jgi:hypothetical protein